MDTNVISTLLAHETLKAEKSAAEKVVKSLEERIDATKAILIEQLGASCEAVCEVDDDEFAITYKPVFKEKVNKEALKANHPDIYEQYFSKEISYRKLNVKRVKKKKKAEAAVASAAANAADGIDVAA